MGVSGTVSAAPRRGSSLSAWGIRSFRGRRLRGLEAGLGAGRLRLGLVVRVRRAGVDAVRGWQALDATREHTVCCRIARANMTGALRGVGGFDGWRWNGGGL